MAQLNAFLKLLSESRSVYLDTNVLIYHLGDVAPYSEFTALLFEFIETGRLSGHTAALSILELNVKPYELNRMDLALTSMALFKNLPHFFIHPLTLDIADKAAQVRARYRLKTPDAIHIASALESRCDLVVGNDKEMVQVKEVNYIYLKNYLV